MNIKVAAITVSEKFINTIELYITFEANELLLAGLGATFRVIIFIPENISHE